MSARKDTSGSFIMIQEIAKDYGLNEEQTQTFFHLIDLFFDNSDEAEREYDSIVEELSEVSPIFDAIASFYQHAISGVPYI